MSKRKLLAAIPKDIDLLSDEYLAFLLLDGIQEKGLDGIWRRRFLSKDTRPTEDEGRAALARLLLSEHPPRRLILWALASLFAPDGFCPPDSRRPPKWMLLSLRERRVIFQARSQGHPETARHFEIARSVYEQREAGKPFEQACGDVGAEFDNMGLRQVAKICAKFDLENFWGPLSRARRRRTK
jgi:hypothetical protein